MISVLNEITKLRGGGSLAIDYKNTNRYCVVMNEGNGTKTAYYFSTPIYNSKTRKVVDMRFRKNGDTVYAVGSNANITVLENIRMDNAEGFCKVELQKQPVLISDKQLCSGASYIELTSNGIAVKCPVNGDGKYDFIIEIGEPFLNVRANDKYFALMKERFRPFVVFSCVGSIDANGNVVAPTKMEYQKLTDKKYRLTVSSTSPMARFVMFEGNLYENKLFQDTTVESANPEVNNAFGGTAFIGNTAEFGEQWLYSRPDYSRFSELTDRQIIKAVLHIPKLNRSNVQMSAFRVSSRFCSFGSNWNNKIAESSVVSESAAGGRYHNIDITPVFADKLGRFRQTEGIILKPRIKGGGFTAVSTGDSSYAPQIYEINYR